jgi:hypothetical protein
MRKALELIGCQRRIITNLPLIKDVLQLKSGMEIVSARVTVSELIGRRSGIITNLRLIKAMISLKSVIQFGW